MQSANAKEDVKRLKSKFGKTYKHIGGTDYEEEEKRKTRKRKRGTKKEK
jgi:hypothetical protein